MHKFTSILLAFWLSCTLAFAQGTSTIPGGGPIPGNSNPVFSGNAMVIPHGTTAQRPGSPLVGDFRLNTTSGLLEWYYNGVWNVPSTAPTPAVTTGVVFWNGSAFTTNSNLEWTGTQLAITGSLNITGALNFNGAAGSTGNIAVSQGSSSPPQWVSALPNGTTATTQSAADNSTKAATTAYADREVTAVRNSAAPVTTTNGSTSGSFLSTMPEQGASYKVFVVEFNTVTDAGSTLTYPTAFTRTPSLLNSTTLSIPSGNITTTTIQIPATTAATGNLILIGM